MHSTALIKSLRSIIKYPYQIDGMRSLNDSSAMVQISNLDRPVDKSMIMYVSKIYTQKNKSKFYLEFDDPLLLLKFNDIFENEIDFLKISQEMYYKFNFIYTYILGKSVNYNGFPHSLKDMIEYYDATHSQSMGSYIFKTVVTEDNDHEPLKYMFILSYDICENIFKIDFDFSMNILTPQIKTYFIESAQIEKVIDILVSQYACKPLDKSQHDLCLSDHAILKILNYN